MLFKIFNNKYKLNYNINTILSELIYTRIFPQQQASILWSHFYLVRKNCIWTTEALSVLTNESDYIQAALYKNSHFIKKEIPLYFIVTAPTIILR